MTIPNQIKYDKKHLEQLDKYTRRVKAAYTDMINKVSKYATSLKLGKNGEFYIQNNPAFAKQMNKLLGELYSNVKSVTVSGINSEWELANEKGNALTHYAFGQELDKIPADLRDKYLSGNYGAKQNFINRKVNGLGLSDKVWNNTKAFKKELELALELNIGKGKSAGNIARGIKQFLNEPDKLFRRIKGANGELRLSKAAKLYKPGRGVYRSSYKNAVRLARNEINFSYEGANLERRKKQDFVVGVRIRVSPSHNPKHDRGGISCIALQGNYPANFDFSSKWHVNCKCTSFDILKTKTELNKDIDRILQGKAPLKSAPNKVTKMPANFMTYTKDNAKMWKNWKQKPRFLEANNKLISATSISISEKAIKKVILKPQTLAQLESKYKNYYQEIGGKLIGGIAASKDYAVLIDNYVSMKRRGQISAIMDKALTNYKWKTAYSKGNKSPYYQLVRQYLTDVKSVKTSLIPYAKTTIRELQNYIKQHAIDYNATLYRNVHGPFAKKMATMKVGQVYEEVSFSSTATFPQTYFGDYRIKILVDKGASVAHIANNRELEFLVAPGTKFKVLAKHKNGLTVKLLNK